ncbi:Riboflavin kinase / FMN adenylyltransferase [Caballeronia sordidicola]|nr:Riboflavin kinase / FMN adenylyltransferase [Caballeronia sordidicola]OTP71389.1 Riboflavin kinase / FMN adenylyltransferase [Caballeronia sordidicola]
MALQPT